MQVTLYIADKRTNAFMKSADLCDKGKVYVAPYTEEIERKGTGSTQEFLQRILAQPTNNAKFWIAAVAAEGLMAVAKGINQLSDGNKIMFIAKERND
jgi:hypothetical protein